MATLTTEQIIDALSGVIEPELGKDIVALDRCRGTVTGGVRRGMENAGCASSLRAPPCMPDSA